MNEIISKIGMNNFDSTKNPVYQSLVDVDPSEVIVSPMTKMFFDQAVDDPTKISYFTKEKVDKVLKKETNVYLWDRNTRKKYGIMTKPGKFFRWLFPEMDDKKIKDLAKKYLSLIEPGNFQLTDNIIHAYDEDNYYNTHGSLGSSCMRHKDCSEYLYFYDSFDVQILILLKNDKIAGRALVWNDVIVDDEPENISISGNITVMDRVYTNNENDEELFFAYAKKKGWYRKLYQNYTNKNEFVAPDGNALDLSLSIEGNIFNYNQFPYLDTFSYADSYGLHNKRTTCWENHIELDDTEGGFTSYGIVLTNENELEYESNYVEIAGEIYSKDNEEICYVEEEDEYYLKEDCIEIDGKWYHSESDSICYVDEDDECYLEEDCILINGEWYHQESESICYIEEDQEYYLKEDCIEIDGKTYYKYGDSICYVNENEYYIKEN